MKKRLATVADYVPAGARLADIGSDHAYLPAALASTGRLQAAVVGEVAPGPLANARETVAKQGLTDLVTCRLADGLAAVQAADYIDTVVIAGMGGLLIEKILQNDWQQQRRAFDRLILQPNTDQAALRRTLLALGYQIERETMVAEGRHVYEIIVAQPGPAAAALTAADYFFGPCLRRERSALFLAKWQAELDRQQQVLSRLAAAGQTDSPRYQEVAQRKAMIEEELAHGDSSRHY